MKANVVICEYNPFHNGHKYQINEIKAHNDNPIVAVMSGSFTQRGDVAVTDKFTRARCAVKNGADLVLELPTVFACAPAERFARGGVEIAKALGCAERLCFGTEDGDGEALKRIAELSFKSAFNENVRKNMQSGLYYPQAVEKALELIDPSLAVYVKKPNNILAIEYLKAIRGTEIEPLIIQRKGAEHDGQLSSDGFASGSKLREMISIGESIAEFSPIGEIENPADIIGLERAILYKLRTMSREEIANLPDVSEGLENRIYDAVRAATTLDELLFGIKTKRYTMAKLRRIIITALLGITKKHASASVPYLRVLAFNTRGAELMGEIKRRGTLPLITSAADAESTLDNSSRELFDIDLRASDIFALATKRPLPCGTDFTEHITITR